MQYAGMRRNAKPRNVRRKGADNQKRLVRFVLIFIVFILLIIFVFGNHGLLQLYKLKKERLLIQSNISQLRKEREELKKEKNMLENNLDYIEKLARERFRMAKKGEKVFKVIPKKE
tara:strand:+ start:621 stop:968 length:348 start_codon:yes stop_codon:yes gene_type:complete